MLEKQQNTPNNLIHSLSPYLLQHAYNPVNWHEWGNEAFLKAEQENKPLLISIGYSACHWCHVMAHESFEDPETASIMNAHFICIKIDREELPNIDQLYMDTCQLVNGSGGWPLNAFALPNKKPIHALTYLPKADWQKLLFQIHDLYQNKTEKAIEYAEKLSNGIVQMSAAPKLISSVQNENKITEKAFEKFVENYDETYGGPNRAPKFPLPNNYEFLLRYSQISGNKKSETMALHTLTQMALGGIHDVVGGGFARYSVDKHWFAPHFEKMLYDNAQLLALYSYAYYISGKTFYKQIALNIANFCTEEFLNKEGLYYSALDADTEGKEGYYYIYAYAELKEILGKNEPIFSQYFQCTEAGNWEHGKNILYAIDSIENAALKFNLSAAELTKIIAESLAKLKTYRAQRAKPALDDKSICSWNNLMLKALANAAIYRKEKSFLHQAEQLASNILLHFYKDEKLHRIYKNGQVKINAFLEDYATLIDALIALYQASLNEKYLIKAKQLCDTVLNDFLNIKSQFFEFEAKTENALISPKYDVSDDVINSSNSVMAHNLWLLGWYYNDADYLTLSNNMLNAMSENIAKHAPWYSHWAALQLFKEFGIHQIVLSAEELTFEERTEINIKPNSIIALAHTNSQIPLVQDKLFKGEKRYFHCKDKVCFAPCGSVEELNESI